MPLGPGKYDPYCTTVRVETGAKGVVLIVLDGNLGNGFSIQANVDVTTLLPDMLEYVAKQIRESLTPKGEVH